MTKTFDSAPAATRLAHAWHARTCLAHLPQDERSTTPEQGYAIQDELRAAQGEEVNGYKVAAANADARRASEFGQALFGYMGRARMHASGVTHALSGGACTQPQRSRELFWAHAAARGIRLARGQVITTGTLVQPVDVDEPGEYEGRVGDARVRFTLS